MTQKLEAQRSGIPRWIAYSLFAALAACGSPKVSDDQGGGGSSFSAPREASAAELQAAQGPLAAALGLQSAPDLAKLGDLQDLAGLASAPGLISQLLGDPSANPLGALGASLGTSEELAAAWQGVAANMGPLFKGALDSGCVALTSDGLAFKGCAIPLPQSAVQGTVKLDGFMSVTREGLKLDLAFVGAFDAASACGILKLHVSGDLGAAQGACKGSLWVDIGLDGQLGGKSIALALKEGLSFDLAFQEAQICASGGTVLATRQWSARPDGKSDSSLPDLTAKLDFSACGAATIAFSPQPPSGP